MINQGKEQYIFGGRAVSNHSYSYLTKKYNNHFNHDPEFYRECYSTEQRKLHIYKGKNQVFMPSSSEEGAYIDVFVPFELKNLFKKTFTNAKFNSNLKTWSIVYKTFSYSELKKNNHPLIVSFLEQDYTARHYRETTLREINSQIFRLKMNYHLSDKQKQQLTTLYQQQQDLEQMSDSEIEKLRNSEYTIPSYEIFKYWYHTIALPELEQNIKNKAV